MPRQCSFCPARSTGDQGVYRDADLTAVKMLRHRGVPIDFLHPAARRTFQSEYSAEIVVFLLIFVASALGEQVVQDLARYLWNCIRNAAAPGAASPPQLTVEISKYVEDGDHRELEGLRISGQDPEQVVEAFKQALRQELPLAGRTKWGAEHGGGHDRRGPAGRRSRQGSPRVPHREPATQRTACAVDR